MTEPVKRERPQTIKEQQQRQESSCWERFEHWPAPIVQFQISDKYWLGVPFPPLPPQCIEREDGSCEMVIPFKDEDGITQRLFITGPKVPELFALFCLQAISVIRADGKDITRVDLLAPKESDKQSD
jgi:hypothetical protein